MYCKVAFGIAQNTRNLKFYHHRVTFADSGSNLPYDQVRLFIRRQTWGSKKKLTATHKLCHKIKAAAGGDEHSVLNVPSEEEEEDDVCPVECVREFKTDEDFNGILHKAKEAGALVVVDFYRTSCGSCKYIEQGFAKLCKRAGDQDAPVIFLKHNVLDEYDEQSEVAERLRIKTVPLFHFYKDGVLLEAFATRDKDRITAAIIKYSSLASVEPQNA